tara:strand:- start:275 stop:535 length:261 start_codon:yes stop_codon:yes gene_type:complete
MTDIERGEEFLVLTDYDLFELNVRGLKGVYLKTDNASGKYLLRFSENGEYAEVSPSDLERVSPGTVSDENKEFVSNVKTMVCTFET